MLESYCVVISCPTRWNFSHANSLFRNPCLLFLLAEWSFFFSFVLTDKDVAPKTVNDLKLINAGRILENNRTLAESRVPVGEVPGGVITMHVVVRPPQADKNSGIADNFSPLFISFSWLPWQISWFLFLYIESKCSSWSTRVLETYCCHSYVCEQI